MTETQTKIRCRWCGRIIHAQGTTFTKWVHKSNGRMICTTVFDEHGRANFAEPA